MICQNCTHTDGNVYTSIPPQIFCTIKKEYKFLDNKCDIEFVPLKKGTWKTCYLDHVAMGERPKIFYCSVCNYCAQYTTNYCPNCGAKMEN